MSSPSVKILGKKKLSDFEYYVKVKYKGKEHDDAFSLPGKKLALEKIANKKSIGYIVAKAMIDAVDEKTAKAEEVYDASSSDQ